MKRVIRTGAFFGGLEVVLSAAYAIIGNQYPELRGKLWLVDLVVYLILGALLMVRLGTPFAVIFVVGACVGTIDCTFGGSLGYFLRSRHEARVPFGTLFATNLAIYPTLAAIATCAGALLAMPFRRIDNSASGT